MPDPGPRIREFVKSAAALSVGVGGDDGDDSNGIDPYPNLACKTGDAGDELAVYF